MTLFDKFRASDIKRAHFDEVVQAVRKLSDDELLTLNDDEFIEAQVRKYHVDVPVCDFTHEDAITQTTGNIEVRDAYSGDLKTMRGAIVKFAVPFEGTADVFHWVADAMSLTFPEGGLHYQTVTSTVTGRSFEATDIARMYARWRDSIQQHLDWQKACWTTFDDEVRQAARSTITDCRSRIISLRDATKGAAEMLGLRVRVRTDDPQTFVAPAIRKKIEVTLPRTSPKKVTPSDPMLGRNIYDDIVRVLVGAGTTLERSGAALRSQDEETLRDILMLPLNSHFEGMAHGEAFNKQGKTDIIVRFERANLFVAECKIWDGPKVITEAIDQLFTYLTWKDSKSAIIVFNRNVDFTSVLRKALDVAKAHPQFAALICALDENAWELQFKLPSDAQRRITVTLMLFDMGPPS